MMRKLDDGTYMYDMDSPWDGVLATGLGLFLALFGVGYWGYSAFRVYEKAGLEDFQFLSDTGTIDVAWVLISATYVYNFVRSIRFQIYKIKNGKISHG